MDNQKAIGIFDSGLGGLTAAREVMDILPGENIIYFGDTGRVPYGSKSLDTVRKFAMQDANFLLSKNVKMIIAACGTVSSVVETRNDFSKPLPVPYVSVVKPACYCARHKTSNGRIGVIGTSATISTHSYKKRLLNKNPEFSVFEQACPLFVPLVESGKIDENDMIVKLIVKESLEKLKKENIDTLILGCTHYPLLSKAIQNEMGDKVTLINSGKEAALYAKKVLSENDLLSDRESAEYTGFYVSDTPQNFSNIASLFLGRDISGKVSKTDIEAF